jgi:hypothetical protein
MKVLFPVARRQSTGSARSLRAGLGDHWPADVCGPEQNFSPGVEP